MKQLLKPLCIAVFPAFLATNANAMSVEIELLAPDYCQSYLGQLGTTVTGGTAPYSYAWYRWEGGLWTPVFAGIPEGMLIGAIWGDYKVVVTDAVLATAEATASLPGLIGVSMSWSVLPYVQGSPPVLVVQSYTDMGSVPIQVQGPSSSEVASTPLGGLYMFVLSPGVIDGEVVASVQVPGGSYCYDGAWFTVPPPTVVPQLTVVEVEGSCSNAPTGGIALAVSNGVNAGGMNLRLKNAAGAIVASSTDVGQLPTSRSFANVAAGTYWVVISDAPTTGIIIPGFIYDCQDSIQVTVPDLGATCGLVQGRVFLDNDLNCTYQGNEPSVPDMVLEVLPGPFYANTNSAGQYSVVLAPGNYTIALQSASVEQQCTGAIPFTITGSSTPLAVNVPGVSALPLDVELAMNSGPARPGMEFEHYVSLRSLTYGNSGNLTITMQFDPAVGYLNASPAPSSVVGNTITWNQVALYYWEQRAISVRFMVPPDVGLIGTDLFTTCSVATALTDGNLANNTATTMVIVTGSIDPNDKLPYTSSGSTTEFDPGEDEWIDYAIRFQNTGTDTAFNVIITDTLASNLDPGSIIVGASSHPFTWQLRGAGILKFYFFSIALPDSNVNEPGSHGSVSFRIRPQLPLQPGDEILNAANIYFDFNAPVITEPCVLVVPEPDVHLNAKVFLGGAITGVPGTMTDALRGLGVIPHQEPYSGLGQIYTGSHGPLIVASNVLAVPGPDAIVDWVLVELRNASQPSMVMASRAALVQRDGDVVSTDGITPVSFDLAATPAYVAIRHRNHLGVMTATPIALTSTPAVVDFTDPATATWGVNAQNDVGGTMALWPGDLNYDGVIKYNGVNNDRDPVLVTVGGNTPTGTLVGVYHRADVNMDGTVKYHNSDNDRDVILQTIGGSVPTATRLQQLP
ncbi:MAG: hypothetical protein ABI432_05735 [Flavobacteriales bacterium]